MIIALPLTENETFSSHFGASSKAALFEVDLERREITCSGVFTPPGLAPCEWAVWLRDLGVNRVFASGIGRGAQARLSRHGIEVVAGVEADELETLIQAWLNGTLAPGANLCAGGHKPGHGGCHQHHGHDHGDGHGHHADHEERGAGPQLESEGNQGHCGCAR